MPLQHEVLEMFDVLWWQTIFLSIYSIIFIVYIGKLIVSINKKVIHYFTYCIAFILLANEIIIQLYQQYIGIWSVIHSLPLHLCGLSSILSWVVLFYRNQLLYEILILWGITGAFHSLLTPEFTLGTEGYLFYDYYISHVGILISSCYLTFVLDMRPRQYSWLKTFLIMQLLIPTIGFINWLFNANYIYLSQKPIVDNPFLMGEWPIYIIAGEVLALLHFLVIYVLIKKLSIKKLTNQLV